MSANPLSSVTTYLTNDEWFTGTLPATASAKADFPDQWENVESIFDIWLQVGTNAPYNTRVYNPAAAGTTHILAIMNSLATTSVTGTTTAPAIVIGAKSSTNYTVYFSKNGTSGALALEQSTGTVVAVKFWVRRFTASTPPA